MRTLFTALLLTYFTGLHAQNPQATKYPYLYKGVTDTACAVEIAFGSYGGGIDGKALESVQALIKKYNVRSTSKALGREGEMRICLPLTELSKRRKKAFTCDLKKIAKKGQLVSVSIR
jgi:hypothetical protein